MEDAAEALVMAFSVFMFVIALGLGIINLNLSKEVTDIVIAYNDKEYVEQYKEIEDEELDEVRNGRVVGSETVIPTLYRYYKEKFSVDIDDSTWKAEDLFDIATERLYYINVLSKDDSYKYTVAGKDIEVQYKYLYPSSYVDHKYGVIWITSETNIDTKKRVDAFVSNSKMMHNGEEAKYYNKEFNFDQLYYQQFEEKDQGTKLALPDTEDGTYVIQDAGTKKMYIHFAKKE